MGQSAQEGNPKATVGVHEPQWGSPVEGAVRHDVQEAAMCSPAIAGRTLESRLAFTGDVVEVGSPRSSAATDLAQR